jgi:hypothetical protein
LPPLRADPVARWAPTPLPLLQRLDGGRMSEPRAEYDAPERVRTADELAGGASHLRLPRSVHEHYELPAPARYLYLCLQGHMNAHGQCYPSQEALARELGAGVRSVQRYLSALEAAGLVRCDPRQGVGGGGSAAMSYRLYPDGDAPTNPPNLHDEPAILAGSDGRTRQICRTNPPNLQDEPAKNDAHMKVERLTLNEEHERGIRQRHAHARATTHSARAGDEAAGSRARPQGPAARVGPAAASPGAQVVIEALGLAGTATEVRAVDAILLEFPHVHHASVAAVCADWWHRKHRGPPSVAGYRNWLRKEPEGGSDGTATADGPAGAGPPGRRGRGGDVPGVPGGAAGAQERAEQWQRDARERLRRARAGETGDALPGVPVPGG